eukprot:gene1015-731_t
MVSLEKKSLSAAQCSIGLASSESWPDGYLFDPSPPTSREVTPLMRGIVEAKESAQELIVAMRQGISEAVNVVMQQLMRGVWWAEVVVPILATNGHKLQLGVIYLLYPAFPVFTLVTPELHLLNDQDRTEAVRVLVCLQRFLSTSMFNRDPQPTTAPSPSSSSSSTSSAAAVDVGGSDRSILPILPPAMTQSNPVGDEGSLPSLSQLEAELPNVSPTNPPAYLDQESSQNDEWHPLQKRFLDKTKYFFKPLRSMFFVYGKSHVEQSLRMHFKVMKALHSVEACREWVVFPICIREDDDNSNKSGLVYPRLDPTRYQIGLPRDPSRRKEYFETLRNAMNVIHDGARVLHLDLYPSNIMWSWNDESQHIQIKLIDWDAAVLMDWYEYPSETAKVLVNNNRIRLAAAYDSEIGRTIAGGNDGLVMSRSMDTCFINLMEEFQSDKRLYSETKSDLDDAFRRLVETKLASKDLPIPFYA